VRVGVHGRVGGGADAWVTALVAMLVLVVVRRVGMSKECKKG